MDRIRAIQILQGVIGKDLHELALEHGIVVETQSGMVNKGWAGHVCERVLGLPLNSAQSPNFGSWELKCIPLKWSVKNSCWVPKETMAITMIDPIYVAKTPFDDSHLKSKLEKAVIVARTVGNDYSEPSFIHKVFSFDLDAHPEIADAVKSDYELVRACLNDPLRGRNCLTGKMGTYIQPRTKGAGHGTTSRAFYARKCFLSLFLDLDSQQADNTAQG